MRITKDSLLKLARNTVLERTYKNRELVCIYLTGSLLSEEPLLGGTTDIDLIFVHSTTPPEPREIIRLTKEVHLDIAHYNQSKFQQPRHLRLDPWLGSFLCKDPICLFDIGHWFEFTQASVCSQFKRPENVLKRARPKAENARRIWFDLLDEKIEPGAQKVWSYLKALEYAANAIAILNGVPLTERRFMLQFPERAAAIERPGLAAGLADLFMSGSIPEEIWDSWLGDWENTVQSIGKTEGFPTQLALPRKSYYQYAIEALKSANPEAAVWILIRTWTRAVNCLSEKKPNADSWEKACETLNLDENHFSERVKALDAYLDIVEETLDIWGQQNGVTE